VWAAECYEECFCNLLCLPIAMDYLPDDEAFQASQYVTMISKVASDLDEDGHDIASIDRRLRVCISLH